MLKIINITTRKKPKVISYFCFGTGRSELKKKLKDEIKYEEQSESKFEKWMEDFQQQGWTVKFSNLFVEFEKSNDPYHLRILSKAKPPPISQHLPNNLLTILDVNTDPVEISAYINKQGSESWLRSEFSVMQDRIFLSSINFIPNYEKDKNDRILGNSKNEYNGPVLAQIKEQMKDHLSKFMEQRGICGELLEKVMFLNAAHEQNLYIQWLRDFNSIV